MPGFLAVERFVTADTTFQYLERSFGCWLLETIPSSHTFSQLSCSCRPTITH